MPRRNWQAEWIEKAKTLSQRKLEKEVARVNPKVLTPERASYVTDEFMKLELGLSEGELEEIKYVQDLVCQSKQNAVSMKDTLLEVIRFYRKHKDPIERAERSKMRAQEAQTKTNQDRQVKPDLSQALIEQNVRKQKSRQEGEVGIEHGPSPNPNPNPRPNPRPKPNPDRNPNTVRNLNIERNLNIWYNGYVS